MYILILMQFNVSNKLKMFKLRVCVCRVKQVCQIGKVSDQKPLRPSPVLVQRAEHDRGQLQTLSNRERKCPSTSSTYSLSLFRNTLQYRNIVCVFHTLYPWFECIRVWSLCKCCKVTLNKAVKPTPSVCFKLSSLIYLLSRFTLICFHHL